MRSLHIVICQLVNGNRSRILKTDQSIRVVQYVTPDWDDTLWMTSNTECADTFVLKAWSSHTLKTFLDVNISSLFICDIFRYHFLATNDRLEFINIARLISFSRKRHASQLLSSVFRLLIQLKSSLWCYLTKNVLSRERITSAEAFCLRPADLSLIEYIFSVVVK